MLVVKNVQNKEGIFSINNWNCKMYFIVYRGFDVYLEIIILFEKYG